MSRVSIVTRIRAAAAAPAIALLLGAPFIAGGIYFLGQLPETLRDRGLTAVQAAHGMETSLYQMEWGITQPGGAEIVSAQRRQFVHWAELAQDHAETADQRRILGAIVQQAEPLLNQLRQEGTSGRMDEDLQRKMRELHGTVSDLVAADDTAIANIAGSAVSQAWTLVVILGGIGLGVPWLSFALVASDTAKLRSELRAMRAHIERVVPRLAAANLAADAEVKAIDDTLNALGFPPPDPKYAE